MHYFFSDDFLMPLRFASPIIVSILLVKIHEIWLKKYQWPIDGFIVYAFWGGMIGSIAAYFCFVYWTIIYEVRYGGLALFAFFLLPSFAIGQIVGFTLRLLVLARKRSRDK